MDPITQGALGAVLPQSIKHQWLNKENFLSVTILGALSGMAPDLDVLIQSPSDPLLFLEYHRQFTHSLLFIPLGALICHLALSRWSWNRLSAKQSYLVCLLGFATHALLDACTSYGTQLFWPFSNARVSWNNVSVVDPLVTVPLVIAVVLAYRKRSTAIARVGFMWVIAYLVFGLLQRDRVQEYSLELAASRGHHPELVSAKPGFATLLVWKSVYQYDGQYYVDGVRAGIDITLFSGQSIEKFDMALDMPWLDPDSQQAKDIERFAWFSQDYLGIDPNNELRIIDIRYSMLPNKIDGLWAVEVDPEAAHDSHIKYDASRDTGSQTLSTYWQMIIGGEIEVN